MIAFFFFFEFSKLPHSNFVIFIESNYVPILEEEREMLLYRLAPRKVKRGLHDVTRGWYCCLKLNWNLNKILLKECERVWNFLWRVSPKKKIRNGILFFSELKDLNLSMFDIKEGPWLPWPTGFKTTFVDWFSPKISVKRNI